MEDEEGIRLAASALPTVATIDGKEIRTNHRDAVFWAELRRC
jgi:hypothetical protein